MFLAAGQRLGPYEIIAPLGAGGMGEVYRARDTRLNRTVAVKVLPPEQSGRATRRERFQLEGRAISSLSHPHICSLFDVGEHNGLLYLVMEYLEGETLHARLKRGRLPVADALALGIQIGSALEQAHRRGLIHRDLNPSNIMLLKPGGAQAKLLDFGLAKMLEPSGSQSGDHSLLTTETRNITAEGVIVGTFQYMAPEQLEGKEATPCTDIFALGCVLYEMTTGRRAFSGGSRASLISSILKDEPSPVSALEPGSSPALDRVIHKCLAKDPEARWQSARDLVDELKWLVDSSAEVSQASAGLRVRRRSYALAGWGLAAALAIILVVVASWPRVMTQRAQFRFEVTLPDKTEFREFNFPVLSPDGTRVAFAATNAGKDELMVRKLNSMDIQHLPGTDDATYPFWSPDSRSIAFFASGKLKKLELGSGSAVTVADAPGGIGGSWGHDGTIVFCPKIDSPLERVNESGGMPVQVTRLDAERHQTSQLFPNFLPDGHHFLFYGISAGREDEYNGAYVGSIDSQEVTRLFKTKGRIEYASPGYVLFPHGETLMAQRFDTAKLRPVGEPTLVLERTADLGAVLGSAFSEGAGALAYRSGAGTHQALTWLNRKGVELGTVAAAGDYGNPSLSPDGNTLAVDYRESSSQPRDIWLIDLRHGSKSRFTFDPADDFNPVWSPDGTHIAFTSTRRGSRDIFQKLVSGAGPEELLLQSAHEKNMEDWSPDGRYLLFNTRVPGQPIELWAAGLGDRKPFRVVAGPGSSEQGRFSPDGKWVAYRAIEGRQSDIFVQEFPAGGGKWQISTTGGTDPQWGRDGKELFYRLGNRLMRVTVHVGEHRFGAEPPAAMFEVAARVPGHNGYLPSRDGQRFLFGITPAEGSASRFHVLTDWTAVLKR